MLLVCAAANLCLGQELGGSCDSESLPRPQVDVAELSAQVCGLLTFRAVGQPPWWLFTLADTSPLLQPQITELSNFSDVPAPAVTRIVYTPQDMAARE